MKRLALVFLGLALSLSAGPLRADSVDGVIQTLKPSPLDHAVWAGNLLKAAESLQSDPNARGRLYEAAHEHGLEGPKGYPTAVAAARALRKARPKQRAAWQQKLLAACKLDWQAADRGRKKEAGRAYAEEMIAAADGLAASRDVSGAVKLYAQAARLVLPYAPDRKDEITWKLKNIRDRQNLRREEAQCKRLLAASPKTVAVRERLIRLYVVELDEPAEAAKLVTADVSESLRTCTPLAARGVGKAAKDVCLELGDWYRSLAAKATPPGRAAALSRAMAYYERFVSLEQDAVRGTVGKARLARARKEWAEAAWSRESLRLGLVLQYDFDRNEGRKVTDKSGRGNHGKVHGAKWTRTGKVRGAYRFDHKGGDTYIEAANTPSLNPAKQLTVAAWASHERGNVIVDKSDWDNGNVPKGYVLRYESGKADFNFGSSGWHAVYRKKSARGKDWCHLVGCYDGKELRLYANGVLIAQKPVEKSIVPSRYPLRVGHGTYDKGGKRRYYGLIDEVMVWNRALSEAEVRQLYWLQDGR